MSIFSDHECGALSDFEFDQECRRMNRQDRYEREHLYDDPDYPDPESEEMETEQDQAYTESCAESDDISHIFDNVTQEDFEKIAKALTGWDTENIRKKIQGKRMTNEEAIAILEEEAEFLYGEDKPHNRTAFDMAIKALSVPEREKGEWIRFKNFESGYFHIKCSNCGQYWSIDDHAKTFKYCFNCGAVMKKGENE